MHVETVKYQPKKKGIVAETHKYEPRPKPPERKGIVAETHKYEPPKEITPAQAVAISKFQAARERFQTSLRRRRYDPDKTYLYERPHPDKPGEFLKGYQVLSGTDVIRDIDRGYSDYWKGQRDFQKAISSVPFGFTLRKTDEGYVAGGASQEFIEKHKGKYVKTFGMDKQTEWIYSQLSKITHQSVESLAETHIRFPFGGEPQKQYLWAKQNPLYKAELTFAGAVNPFAWIAGERYGAPSGFISLPIGTALSPLTGTDIRKDWEYSLEHLPYSILATGGEFVGGWFAAPAVKWALKPIVGPILSRLPPKGAFLSGISRFPGYRYVSNIKSIMGGYTGKYADVRISQGIARNILRGTKSPQLFGKIPGYIGRQERGMVSTLEQMKGTLVRSGWRGGDPLKSAAWQYHYFLNPERALSRGTSSLIYKITKTGGVTARRVFSLKPTILTESGSGFITIPTVSGAFPRLATGEFPSVFRMTDITVATKGISRGMGFHTRPGDVSTMIIGDKATSKTGQSIQTILTKPASGVSVPSRPVLSYVDPRLLQFLDTLQAPYQQFVYPSGVRIGVRTVTPIGKTILASGSVVGLMGKQFGKTIFDTLTGKKVEVGTDFRTLNLLKGDNIFSRLGQGLLTGKITATGTLNLTGSATDSITASILLQKTGQVSRYKQQQTMNNILLHSPTFSYGKPSTPRPPITPYFGLPLGLFGRGKLSYGMELWGEEYKVRKVKLPYKKVSERLLKNLLGG